jgi:hypothetical protein
MLRSPYYQEVGNPIQRDRLPNTIPTLVFAAGEVSFRQGLKAVFTMLGTLLVVVILSGCFVNLLITAPFGSWLYLLIAPALVLVCWSVTQSKLVTALSAGYFIASTVLYFNQPLAAQALLAAFALSCFCWLFATHWIAVCLAAPFDRETATKLKATWQLPLALAACTPLLLTVFVICTQQIGFAALLGVTLCLVQLLSSGPTRAMAKLQTGWESLVSWCTYNGDELRLPGILRSPAGNRAVRSSVTCAIVVLVSAVWLHSLEPHVKPPAEQIAERVIQNGSLANTRIGPPLLKEHLPLIFLVFLFIVVTPIILVIALPIGLMLSILYEAREAREASYRKGNWDSFIHDLQHSPDANERHAYYMGVVEHDGSPLIVPRKVYCEHAHFPGDSGSGKTAQGLAPWIEQTILFGDCSLIAVDLKADSLELFATLIAAREKLAQRTGKLLPIKYFTNQSHLSTNAFNPLTQPYWNDFDPYSKTDILCGAAGLLYGTDYGPGWYSAANAAVLHHAMKRYPNVSTFRELSDRVRYIVANAKKSELHSELRNAGVHVQAVLDRLASFDALNVAPGMGYSQDVLDQAIDLRDIFRRPQIQYFHLSSTIAAGSSPEIARLFVYSLLCAATQTERKCQVFLVIDEFQRMVAHNVEYILQLARSMGVGVILANQSMQDLGDLIPAIEANCRYRQWFSVSSLDDRERLVRGGGKTVERITSISRGTSGPNSTYSETATEQVMDRLTHNDVLLASDHEFQSIVQISRGAGYAQYGGFPFTIRSNYHISKREYERRKAMPWPTLTAGTFIPRDERKRIEVTAKPTQAGPIVTTETIGDLPLFDSPKKEPRKGRQKPSDGSKP